MTPIICIIEDDVRHVEALSLDAHISHEKNTPKQENQHDQAHCPCRLCTCGCGCSWIVLFSDRPAPASHTGRLGSQWISGGALLTAARPGSRAYQTADRIPRAIPRRGGEESAAARGRRLLRGRARGKPPRAIRCGPVISPCSLPHARQPSEASDHRKKAPATHTLI